MQKTTVAIIDRFPIVRAGFSSLLKGTGEVEIVGEGATVDEALSIAMRTKPDMMLTELSIDGGGLCLIKRLRERCPDVRRVVLTQSEREADLMAAMEAGACGYLLKDIGADELALAIGTIGNGRPYVTPHFAATLLTRKGGLDGGQRQADSAISTLSAREIQVLKKAATGATNREIADVLHLSEKTVKHYMTVILQKINVRNRVEAAMAYRRHFEPAET